MIKTVPYINFSDAFKLLSSEHNIMAIIAENDGCNYNKCKNRRTSNTYAAY